MKNNYTKQEILDSALIGLEFEFYSSLKPIKIARNLSKVLGKRVVIPYSIPTLGEEPKLIYHSPIKVTENVFKLEIDYSGGGNMFELVTGPIPYKEGKNILLKILNWIKEFGYTNERCSLHVNISFNYTKIKPLKEIIHLDILKLILSLDEKFIYKNFPTRKNSVYARSIKQIVLNSILFYKNIPSDWDVSKILNLPKEKYFGVNFKKLEKNYLEFRYIGGKNYEKKKDKIIDTIEYFIITLFNAINSNGYTDSEKKEIKETIEKFSKIIKLFSDYENFKKHFPKIEITIDLENNPEIIKSYWLKIGKKIFKLIINSGLKRGRINYDTDYGILQLANVKLKNAYLSGVEIIKSQVEGVFKNCNFYYSKIVNSRIFDSEAIKENEFVNSKLKNVTLYNSNVCNNCFIRNDKHIINCEINGGVIRKGIIGNLSKISKETIIVEETINKNSKKKKEIKDLNWFKKLANKTNKNKNKKNK